jgi:signal transduction histidine kinase
MILVSDAGPGTAADGFEFSMQRACGVGLTTFVVQGYLQALLAPELYPHWWWWTVAPAMLATSIGLMAICLRGMMRPRWAVAVVVPASACFALTSVATKGSVLVDATSVTTIAIGMAGVIGFLNPPRWALPCGLLMLGSLAVSMALTREQVHTDLVGVTAVGSAMLFLGVVQAALARRTTAAEDEAVGRLRSALIADRAATAARADRRELERRMHDTVLNTLTALGRGGLLDSPVLRARCAADARFLRELRRGASDLVAPDSDLLGGLRLVADLHTGTSFTVTVSGPAPGDLAPVVVAAFVAAASEAVTNAARHSGAPEATIRARATADGCEVTVRDRGRGLDAGSAESRLGIRRSILDRMTDVGGCAEVAPAAGGGTQVRLWWPR